MEVYCGNSCPAEPSCSLMYCMLSWPVLTGAASAWNSKATSPESVCPAARGCAALQGAAAADTSKLRADLDAALAELKDVKAARSAADKASKVGRRAGCCLLGRSGIFWLDTSARF